MPRRSLSLIICSLIFAVGVAQAQVAITYSSGGYRHFSMIVADGWRVNVGSEGDLSRIFGEVEESARLISAMPNDGAPLWFGMWVPDDLVEVQDAENYMQTLGLDLLADIVVKERRLDRLNGMEVHYFVGSGKKEDEVMDFRTAFVQLSRDSVAIAIYIGPPEATRKHGGDLVRMINSVQPVNQEMK